MSDYYDSSSELDYELRGYYDEIVIPGSEHFYYDKQGSEDFYSGSENSCDSDGYIIRPKGP